MDDMLKDCNEFGYPKFKNGEKVLSTLNNQYSSMLQDIRVYKMKNGETKKFLSNTMEEAILLVKGKVKYKWNDKEKIVERKSFINEGPYCLHVSINIMVEVVSYDDTEILVQRTKNEREFGAVFYTAEQCIDADSCPNLFEGKAHRIVRTIFDFKNAPYSNMVLGEIITKQGGWCSYIPHWHPQPEVYYYRYENEEGFGACFIGDNVYKVIDGSFAAITPGETHPQSTAPGYPQYCVWMIRHLPGNPWIDRVDDERYKWLVKEKIVYR